MDDYGVPFPCRMCQHTTSIKYSDRDTEIRSDYTADCWLSKWEDGDVSLVIR